MAKGYKYLVTEIFILENMNLEVQMDMVSITGTVGHFTVVNFYPEWGTDEESGRWCKEILMKVSIWMTRRMDEALTSGKVESNT